MLRGSWVKFAALGLIALISFGSAFWLISDANSLQSLYEQQAKAKADAYADRSYIAVENRCRPLAPLAEYECIREENQTARQGQHDEYDLQAQLVTSVWTRYMGVAAMIGMGVGILGVGLVYFTFQATREGNKINQRIGEAQTRCYLTITKASIKIWKGGVPEIRFSVKNSGNSPARNLQPLY